MKKFGIVMVIILILVSVAGCGKDSALESLEERVAALERENARLASQLVVNTLPESGNNIQTSEPTLPNSGQNESSTSAVSEEASKDCIFSKYYSNVAKKNRYVYTSNLGCIYIDIQDGWSVIEEGEKLVLQLKKGWIDISMIYEVDRSILTGPNCERKIRSITSEFASEELKLSSDLRYALQYSGEEINLDDIWWIEIVYDNGACYYHAKSTHTNMDDFKYSLLKYEAYYSMNAGTLHVTVQVNKYNYEAYYDSLETTIEKNQAEKEYWNLFEGERMGWYCADKDYLIINRTDVSFKTFLIPNAVVQ